MSACAACLRRTWLLCALNGRLEYRGRARERLVALLELAVEQLIRTVGGTETEDLLERYLRLDPVAPTLPGRVQRICRHDPRFPGALAHAAGAPRLLQVAGGLDRLCKLLGGPVVAIVGARAASDYGIEVAHGLAHDLAESGVTVLSGLTDGIAAAAHTGALDARGPTVTVMDGGVDVCRPSRRRQLHERLCSEGCALAELPCGHTPRGWCHTARARIVAALAQVLIVVEARERPGDLVHARIARDAGRKIAAIPGRLGSPLAAGPHTLLREGAQLVRDAQDVLALLDDRSDERRPAVKRPPARQPPIQDAGLRAVLDQVGEGRDTLSKLLAAGAPERGTLIALAQLELSGALVRGDAGRYVARV